MLVRQLLTHWLRLSHLPGHYIHTSLQARSADLPASPAGLLGRFAPSGFALCARISLASLARVSRFALTKIFGKKKCVSIDSKCSETRKNAKKFFLPFLTHYALRAKFTKIFEKNKCVSIDSKCSETRKNAKKIFLPFLTHYALRA